MKNDVNNNYIDSSDVNDLNFSTDEFVNNSFGTSSQPPEASRNAQTEKEELEQAQKNVIARKRIDELIEKKRLKDLLDDSEDW